MSGELSPPAGDAAGAEDAAASLRRSAELSARLLAELRESADPSNVAGMARYGISTNATS